MKDFIPSKKPTGGSVDSSCALCEGSNLASICAPCVNYRNTIPSRMQSGQNMLQGLVFLIFGFTLFLLFFYAAIISKFLPPFENRISAAIQSDRYYCLLIPLTLPLLVVSVFFHWLSMKLFKHA